MTLTYKTGDLFTAPRGTVLAHCISANFALGAGIAKTFDYVYNMREKLFTYYPDSILDDPEDRSELIGTALLVDDVFNLVTKRIHWDKPTYADLEAALVSMRDQMELNCMHKLAIPKIGCGLDKLEWDKVESILQDVFKSYDIEITVYTKE